MFIPPTSADIGIKNDRQMGKRFQLPGAEVCIFSATQQQSAPVSAAGNFRATLGVRKACIDDEYLSRDQSPVLHSWRTSKLPTVRLDRNFWHWEANLKCWSLKRQELAQDCCWTTRSVMIRVPSATWTHKFVICFSETRFFHACYQKRRFFKKNNGFSQCWAYNIWFIMIS